MRSIQDSCEPREDLLKGAFNPEIFTASLSAVIDAYRGRRGIRSVYVDPGFFFREATFPTEGMSSIVRSVVARLDGDTMAPAIHRLETSFGGGKTHALIALTHLGFCGSDVTELAEPLFGALPLPPPAAVSVVGVAGDELPVHKPQGTALIPYTLWGEIAFQVGGDSLYRQVEADATSFAAPGRAYFEAVLGGRKAIIMLDELAQYAARLEAARADASEQLAAFLMGLNGYARNHAGVAVIVTLASERDAFARESRRLRDLIGQVRGQDVDSAQAQALASRAAGEVQSVVARDATTVVPVQASEVAGVLAKRLFTMVDRAAAQEVVAAYIDMYAKSASLLPEEAARADIRDRMLKLYPFHPTLVDFLNQKLATVETFQGTRGVLRVLALAVRALWAKKTPVPMIHACHLDLRDARTVDEIIGRTGAGALLAVLNTDVGGPDTADLAGSRSRAELADQRNPHPAGWPLHELVWKTVFLHSLVGRGQGLGSTLFGITVSEAVFATSFPGLTPPQVEAALDLIRDNVRGAYYLRFTDGRYYASLDPSIARAFNGIFESLKGTGEPEQLAAATARKIVDKKNGTFEVATDVSLPEHVPDNRSSPTIAIVALDADQIDANAIITTAGPNRPRVQQNLVFVLVPETVHVKGETWTEDQTRRAHEQRNQLEDLARTVLAMRRLDEKPQHYGIRPEQLQADNFKAQLRERELALQTRVTQLYTGIWFPTQAGISGTTIKTAGGEGGASIIEQIRETLRSEGELITPEMAGTQEIVVGLGKLFFGLGQTPTLDQIGKSFATLRHWPVLADPGLLEQVVRVGVTRGAWCLFRMGGEDRTKPVEIFARDLGDVPLTLDLAKADWALVTLQGARQRGWMGEEKVDVEKVERWVQAAVADEGAATVDAVIENIAKEHGQLPEAAVLRAVEKLVAADKLVSYQGEAGQEAKPGNLVHGQTAILHGAKKDDVLITPAEASRRGWLIVERKELKLTGREAAQRLVPLLNRLGSLYNRGAKSSVGLLELVDLELGDGARLRVTVENAPPAVMKKLGELFETLALVGEAGSATEADIEIVDPQEDCPFVQALKTK